MNYKIPQTVFIQEVDSEVIILDTQTQEYFSINEVGKDIWEAISNNISKEELVEELVSKYEVPKEQIEVDLQNFCEALEQKGLIKKD